MHPTATDRTPETFMWADVIPLHGENNHQAHNHSTAVTTKARNQANEMTASPSIRVPQTQGQPWRGPIQLGDGRMAEHMVQVGYNAQHKVPWHWPVPAYLVTKGIGAGLFMVLSLGWGLNLFPFDGLTAVISGFISLLFIAITTGLLVFDLEKPERFLYILLRPQWKSWLTKGAFLLISFTIVGGLWWLYQLGAYLFDFNVPLLGNILLWLGLPLAIGVAIYTAFLFAQAEGRDLWQSPLLPFHMVVQAIMAGSGALLFLSPFTGPQDMVAVAKVTFVTALIIDLFITLLGEFGIPHASEVAALAAHDISHGRYKNHFWWGSIALGHIVPLLLILLLNQPIVSAIAAVCTIIGLFLFEYAFVMAPQDIPNS
jgi:formate-dependent nitrite reductase membrane component NrfD